MIMAGLKNCLVSVQDSSDSVTPLFLANSENNFIEAESRDSLDSKTSHVLSPLELRDSDHGTQFSSVNRPPVAFKDHENDNQSGNGDSCSPSAPLDEDKDLESERIGNVESESTLTVAALNGHSSLSQDLNDGLVELEKNIHVDDFNDTDHSSLSGSKKKRTVQAIRKELVVGLSHGNIFEEEQSQAESGKRLKKSGLSAAATIEIIRNSEAPRRETQSLVESSTLTSQKIVNRIAKYNWFLFFSD